MFKEQIAEKLRAKSEIKRFGLSNEAIDRIASAREKTVTEESQVETVLTDAETMRLVAEELMKHRDQEIGKKTELQSAYDDYKAKHPEGSDPDPEPDPDPKPDIAKLIADGIASGLQPLKDEIAALKSSASAKEALSSARESFFGGDYAKKYKDEADDAWERATELNAATGSKMTAEELASKATTYFNKAVSRKGVDTSKPFVADKTGDEDEGTTDWGAEKKRLQDAGKLPKEQQV